MTQVCNALLGEGALGQFGLPLITVGNGQDLTEMLEVVFISLAVNQNIIEENQGKLAQNRG
jgi:hypothetical protein